MLEHPRVPPGYLTNRMPQGYALVQGTQDGESMPTGVFVRLPKKLIAPGHASTQPSDKAHGIALFRRIERHRDGGLAVAMVSTVDGDLF